MTQRELARLAGVSPATVSLALRNHPRISKETRQRVQDLAGEAHYRVDPRISDAMQRIRTKEKPAILEVLAWVDSHGGAETFIERIRAGAEFRAKQLRCRIDRFDLGRLGGGEVLSRILHARGIRGILVGPLRKGREELDIAWDTFQSVGMGITLKRPNIHRISPHHYENAIGLFQRLRANGFSRIAYYNTADIESRSHRKWLAAYLVDCQEAGASPLHRVEQIPSKRRFDAWLSKGNPDCIVSNYFGVREWIPPGVPLAMTAIEHPATELPLSGVDEQPEHMGSAAVDLLLAHLHRNEIGIPAFPKTVSVPGKFVALPSPAVPKGRAARVKSG